MFWKLSTVLVVCALPCCFGERAFAQNVLHSVYGDAADDALGTSVSGAGDVNNDGYADFIAGAIGESTNGSAAGMIRVYSGQTGAVLFSRYGDATSDYLGVSVSGAGDVNNDGFDDFCAGAHGNDTNGGFAGMIRVYSGQTGAVLYNQYGDAADDYLGSSVSGAGDVNNDGYADFIAGAQGNDANGAGSGAVRVYSGQTGAVLYSRYGDAAGDNLGFSASDGGDINNDGFEDFIAGAIGIGSGTGMIRVYSGRTGAVLYSRYGGHAQEYLGVSVSGGGDVNNDGYADFIAGAVGNDTHGYRTGMIRVYSGQTGAVLYSRYGDEGYNHLGNSVSGAADINNDGFDDFCAGAQYAPYVAGFTGAGMIRVYSGQTGAVLYNQYGDAPSDFLGESVSGAGDVNADGILDVIAGAWSNDAGGIESGMARVYTGPCAVIESYGVGCLGPADTHIPMLSVETGCFGTGGEATLKIENAWGGGFTYLLLSTQRASVYWKFDCSFLVQSPYSVIFLGTLNSNGPPPNGNGWLDLSLQIPNPMSPATLTLQAGIVQPGIGAKNLTNGVEINVP